MTEPANNTALLTERVAAVEALLAEISDRLDEIDSRLTEGEERLDVLDGEEEWEW